MSKTNEKLLIRCINLRALGLRSPTFRSYGVQKTWTNPSVLCHLCMTDFCVDCKRIQIVKTLTFEKEETKRSMMHLKNTTWTDFTANHRPPHTNRHSFGATVAYTNNQKILEKEKISKKQNLFCHIEDDIQEKKSLLTYSQQNILFYNLEQEHTPSMSYINDNETAIKMHQPNLTATNTQNRKDLAKVINNDSLWKRVMEKCQQSQLIGLQVEERPCLDTKIGKSTSLRDGADKGKERLNRPREGSSQTKRLGENTQEN
ncbi:hypothetical protein HPG69_016667 [Diceros bicornis minor]|uniref:Uncharacterized protein n=1 Tax=Diceros bicornis minor TaxID=77932 RepID=A0A7J7FNF1_DICBM|nr:hypothetical protein HPG69_016667 [Diceros bicornis minor]